MKIIMQKQHYWLPSTTATTNKINWNGDTLEILCIFSLIAGKQHSLRMCFQWLNNLHYFYIYIHIFYSVILRIIVVADFLFHLVVDFCVFFFSEQHKIKKTKLTFWFQIIGMCWSIIYVNWLIYKIGSLNPFCNQRKPTIKWMDSCTLGTLFLQMNSTNLKAYEWIFKTFQTEIIFFSHLWLDITSKLAFSFNYNGSIIFVRSYQFFRSFYRLFN